MDEEEDDDIHGMSFYLRTSGHKIDAKTELDKYLNEDCEPFIKKINIDTRNYFFCYSWWFLDSFLRDFFSYFSELVEETLLDEASKI